MATTTITTPSANRIGAAFITTYYNALVTGDLPTIVQMYGETSTVGYVECEDTSTRYYRGRGEIKGYHEGHRNTFGPCKVSLRNIDIVPADHNIALTCSGHYLTVTENRVFTQTFVLSPTKYRDNTYYIAGETMRFLTVMKDVAESGVRLVSEEEYHRIMNAPLEMEDPSDEEAETEAIIDAATAVIASALSPSEAVVQHNEPQQKQQRPGRERKPREPRERKQRERKNNHNNNNNDDNKNNNDNSNNKATEETSTHQVHKQQPRERKQRERRNDSTNVAAPSQPSNENNNNNDNNNGRTNKNSRRNNNNDSQRRAPAAATGDAKPTNTRGDRKPREGDSRPLAISIKFGPVDPVFKLSELAKACQGFGNLRDSYWVNEDAVMEFDDAAAVTNAIRKGVTVRNNTWRPRPYWPSTHTN